MICIPRSPVCQTHPPQPPPAEPHHWVADRILEIKTRRSSEGIKGGSAPYQAFVRVANAAGQQAVVRCRYDKHLHTFGRFQKRLFLDYQIFFAPGRFVGTGSRAAWDNELQRHLTSPADACILCGTPSELIELNGLVFYLCDGHPRTPENEARVMRRLGKEPVVVVDDPDFYSRDRGGDGA